MTFTSADIVRQNVGETIPLDGDDTDTMFTDDEISNFLLVNNNLISKSTAMAWRVKAARLAALVDVQEGNSSRKMSQGYVTALSMAKFWEVQPENSLVLGGSRLVTNRRTMPW